MAFTKEQLGCQNRPSQYRELPRIPSRWTYATNDPISLVSQMGYFNNAYSQGMRSGDEIALGCIDDGTQLATSYILGVNEVIIGEDSHFTVYIKDIGVIVPLILMEPFVDSLDINTGIVIDVCPTELCLFNILWKVEINGVDYLVTADARKQDIELYLGGRLTRTIRPINGGAIYLTFEVWVDPTTRELHFGSEDTGTQFINGEYTISLSTV